MSPPKLTKLLYAYGLHTVDVLSLDCVIELRRTYHGQRAALNHELSLSQGSRAGRTPCQTPFITDTSPMT